MVCFLKVYIVLILVINDNTEATYVMLQGGNLGTQLCSCEKSLRAKKAD